MRRGKGFIALSLFLSLCINSEGESLGFKPLQERVSIAALIESGKASQAAGDFETALARLKKALEFSREMKNAQAENDCLFRLGIVSWDSGRIQEAARFFEEASANIRSSGDVELEGICLKAQKIARLYNAAKDHRSSNQFQLSLDDFDQAISLAREIGIEDFELKCLRQESLTYWQMDNAKMFLACNRRGLAIAEKLNHRKEEGRCLNNIGVYYEKLSDYSNALRYFEKALLKSYGGLDLITRAECLTNIGITYLEMGDFIRAESYYKKALKIDMSIGDNENIAKDLNNIGIALTRNAQSSNNSNEQLESALSSFKECLDLLNKAENSEVIIQVINNIGYISYLMGRYDDAKREFEISYQKAKKANYKEANSVVELNLGNLGLEKQEYQLAKDHLERCVIEATKIDSFDTLWQSYFGLGQCYEDQGDLLTALSYFERSIETIEKIRSRIALDIFKIGFVRNKLFVYQHALDILYSLYSAHPSPALMDRMLVTVEKAKARAFLESLIEARVEEDGALTGALSEKEKVVSRAISAAFLALTKPGLTQEAKQKYEQELELREEEYLRMISDAKVESREFSRATSPDVCGIPQAQDKLLDEHTALLEYFVGEKRSYLFVITRHRSELFELPDGEALEKSLKAYLKIISSPSGGPFLGIRAAERITRELAFPLESSDYADIDSLIIIPGGILHYLPFETLRTSTPNGRAFFVERYKISYCPSASSLLVLERRPLRRRFSKNLLAFGAPHYLQRKPSGNDEGKTTAEVWREIYLNDGFSLSPLPFSKNEVQSLARNFPPSQRDIFLGEEATEAVVKALPLDEYQIIHFACHGFLDEKLPFRSALVLSLDGHREEDGFLQVREIYNLKMRADLVVLSACQTGNGSLEKSEGLLGLPRTFFYAGARSVLSSLWPINDQTTASFMDDFYGFLVQGQSKSSALRLAKMKMLRSSHSYPSYWAGFVLHGDPGIIQFAVDFP